MIKNKNDKKNKLKKSKQKESVFFDLIKKIFRNPITYLIIIILIQLILVINVGIKKESFHIDEIYSYILSNSYDTDKISNDTSAWGKWLEGSFFQKYTSVQNKEIFAYSKVNYNNSTDAHPPLYYFLLHTICSLFPNAFSKWFGLGLNCIFFIGIQIILFITVKKITKSNLCAIASVAFYGGMHASLDMLIFIRMYPMVTFFTILLCYLHYLLYLNNDKKILYFICAIITFLGIYTQYYFAFLACFLAIIMCILLLKNKQYKKFILYSVLMLLAVAILFIIYPAAINQITGSETNNIGNEVSKNILNFSRLPSSVNGLFKQIIKGIFTNFKVNKVICYFIIFFTLLSAWIVEYKRKSKRENCNIGRMIFIVLTIITFIIIIVSHISGKFNYLRYVYYIYPLISIFVILFTNYISNKIKLNTGIVMIGIICISLLGTIEFEKNNLSTYLFVEKNEKNKNIEYICNNKPLILINNGEVHHPTGNLEILLNCSQVYLYNVDKEKDINNALNEINTEEGIIIIILTDKEWSNGFDGKTMINEIINESEKLTNYEEIGICDFSNVYIAK